MDIEYLLFLQNLREQAPVWVSAFFNFMSEFTISPACMIIPALLFWCVDKRAGNYLFFNINGANVVNGVIKITACVYRPWIRDSRVHSSLMTSATGYSFPSGHTSTGVALYGGIGVLLKKYGTWAMALCFIPAVLTGFARNWVGAHTPQDVAVGFLVSALILFLSAKLFGWLDDNQDGDKVVAALGLLGCVAVLIYASIKHYPIDYTADGSLLVDPKKMTIDCFKDTGRMIGFLTGWFIERRWIKFETNVTIRCKIFRAIFGVASALLVYESSGKIFAFLGEKGGGFAKSVLIMFYLTVLFPLIFKTAEAWMKQRTSTQNTR